MLSGLHLRMKSWSCCGIQTLDFGAFLAQPGCKVGRHDWTRQVSPTVPELVMRGHFQKSFLPTAPRGQALSIPLVCCANEIPLLIPPQPRGLAAGGGVTVSGPAISPPHTPEDSPRVKHSSLHPLLPSSL